jgi:tRNA(fMet)-specific endonuclease VapC
MFDEGNNISAQLSIVEILEFDCHSHSIRRAGERNVCTSIVVAAELRYGAEKKGSPRLSAQLETILGALEVLAFEAPCDRV